MKLVVDRKTWLRGDWTPNLSVLMSSDGCRCCLGFLGKACGIPDDLMLNIGTPVYAKGGRPTAYLWPIGILAIPISGPSENSDWTTLAIWLNDGPLVPYDGPQVSEDSSIPVLNEIGEKYYPDVEPGEKYRERLLIRHFAKIDIELEFE